MDRAVIVACPIMVVGVVMLCGGCPPAHPKKRPPIDYKRCCTDRLNAHPDSDQIAVPHKVTLRAISDILSGPEPLPVLFNVDYFPPNTPPDD
jgi:hypothetical protein